MNFLQRTPGDPRHDEFHDGHYEYWPLEDPMKTKSSKIPAALISGLELLAAAAAAALLAMALAVLYVTSAPLAIYENSIVLNTNVYNNRNNQSIVYTLSAEADPENILQKDTLKADKDTLRLDNLRGGTAYLLRYFDGDEKEISLFRFTTPGAPDDAPLPPLPTEPEASASAATEPLPAEPEGTGPLPTEPLPTELLPTEPAEHIPVPPVVPGPPAAEPEETQPEETQPEETQPEETQPEETQPEETKPEETQPDETQPDEEPTDLPVALESYLTNFHQGYYTSGIEDPGDMEFTEVFFFENVLSEDFELRVIQNGKVLTTTPEYVYSEETGSLEVSVDGMLFFGQQTTTSVSVITDSGSATLESVLNPPLLDSAALTAEVLEDGTLVFTVTARISGVDTSETMILTANLRPYTGAEDIYLSLEKDTEDPALYTGVTDPVTIPGDVVGNSRFATVIVSGYWDRIDSYVYRQNKTADCTY